MGSVAFLGSILFCCTGNSVAANYLGGEAQLSAVQIELHGNVTVRHQQVTLADVGHVSTADKQLKSRLDSLVIGLVPRNGEPVHLEQDALARWVRRRVDMDGVALKWSGAPGIDVQLAVETLSGDDIAQRAKQALTALFLQKGLRAEVAISQPPQNIKLPGGELSYKVRPFPEASLTAKHQTVWVDIWVDGSFFRTVPVAVDVSVFAPAYVLTRNVAPGQPLDPDAVTVREVEWSGQVSRPLAVIGAQERRHPNPPVATSSGAGNLISTLRVRRPLQAGDTLTRASVENAPLVQQGSSAILKTTQGGIELESRVDVLQDGLEGQDVQVRLPNASGAISARVAGPGVVELR
ncbi:flagella basal body P-ring formation protein FlgA [Herbaspirillum rubrisubalbicans]|uniref:flagella basal body P-ring formation protein FlgA n=1 Tax=Herbaspirillum rubrisubalbicans TaxID=80842 RepID=UPI0015EC62BB|nr:flagella basal body P-ring formation protein FlgA [Herbaspirillum rubrisubalbicans]